MSRFASIFSSALLGTVASLLFAATAIADVNSGPGFYIGAGVGGYHTAEDFKEIENSYVKSGMKTNNLDTPVYGGMFGYKFSEYFRADVNGQYRKFKYSASDEIANLSQKIKNYSVFLNGYVDLPNYTVFTPYVTVGAGYSHINPDSLKFRDKVSLGISYDAPGIATDSFAWNVGVGTRMKFYKSLDLDLGYRYTDLGEVKVDKVSPGGFDISSASQNLKIHQLIVSLICNF